MADKDIAQVLAPLRPMIDAWFVTDLPLQRAAKAEALARELTAAPHAGTHVTTYATPSAALRAALAAATPTDRILVFGSFSTVGGVLKDGLPRTAAPHSR
jgi:dihydrofolate synthase/folylpolyglutamate synthase